MTEAPRNNVIAALHVAVLAGRRAQHLCDGLGNTGLFSNDYDAPINEDEEQYQTYFLNMVDESDLLALLDEDTAAALTTCNCKEKMTRIMPTLDFFSGLGAGVSVSASLSGSGVTGAVPVHSLYGDGQGSDHGVPVFHEGRHQAR